MKFGSQFLNASRYPICCWTVYQKLGIYNFQKELRIQAQSFFTSCNFWCQWRALVTRAQCWLQRRAVPTRRELCQCLPCSLRAVRLNCQECRRSIPNWNSRNRIIFTIEVDSQALEQINHVQILSSRQGSFTIPYTAISPRLNPRLAVKSARSSHSFCQNQLLVKLLRKRQRNERRARPRFVREQLCTRRMMESKVSRTGVLKTRDLQIYLAMAQILLLSWCLVSESSRSLLRSSDRNYSTDNQSLFNIFLYSTKSHQKQSQKLTSTRMFITNPIFSVYIRPKAIRLRQNSSLIIISSRSYSLNSAGNYLGLDVGPRDKISTKYCKIIITPLNQDITFKPLLPSRKNTKNTTIKAIKPKTLVFTSESNRKKAKQALSMRQGRDFWIFFIKFLSLFLQQSPLISLVFTIIQQTGYFLTMGPNQLLSLSQPHMSNQQTTMAQAQGQICVRVLWGAQGPKRQRAHQSSCFWGKSRKERRGRSRLIVRNKRERQQMMSLEDF